MHLNSKCGNTGNTKIHTYCDFALAPGCLELLSFSIISNRQEASLQLPGSPHLTLASHSSSQLRLMK